MRLFDFFAIAQIVEKNFFRLQRKRTIIHVHIRVEVVAEAAQVGICRAGLLYTSPSPRDPE